MKNKYLLIAISAFFLLTFATSCNNSKGANDKSEIEENTENSDKGDAEKNDSLIRDFITNMYEKELYYNTAVQRKILRHDLN